MIKKSIPLMIFFLLIMSISFADVNVEITPITDVIFEDEVALFELKIINTDSFEHYFERPSTYQVDWVTYTSPGSIVVPANSIQIFNLTLDPKITVRPGQQEVLVSFKSPNLDDSIDENILVLVKSLNQIAPEYKISIALGADAPYDVDPREKLPVTVYLRNRNPINIANLTISIKSDLIEREVSFPFEPMEEKTEKIMFDLDRYQVPTEDEISVEVVINNKTFNQKTLPIRVIEYSDLEEKVIMKESLLKTTWAIELTNEGNVVNNGGYLFPVTKLSNLFTSTEPETELIKGDEQYRNFNLVFEPLDTQTIYVETNYRSILYTLIIIILSVTAYYLYRSPIVLKKRIIPIHGEDGAVNEFHIRLLVMNRTKQPVENISITEIVPKIVSVVKEHDIGTIEPSKVIKHDKKGTLLKWEINYLEPFEERIITFKIISKLGIVGSMVLPKTKAKFETSKGHHRITYSGKESLKI
ncbi:hypothetical protein C0585_06645 [Candidatus Woesearchaeota archaeon]|nr:MAG: hypothetical protein C0585_06645 [Candidatus Woesearchaeota archaeon]